MGTAVQVPDAVVGADHDVLDAGAAPSGQVDAGLHGERHPGLQGQLVAGDDVGPLVRVQPDPVAGAMDEVLPPPGVVDHAAGGGVDVLRRDAPPPRGDGGLLGGLQHRVPLGDLRRHRTADDVGAGAVRPVPGGRLAADVDADDVA